MAIAFGSVSSLIYGIGRTTSSVPVPSSVAANDIILVHFYQEDAIPTITPPAGFSEITFSTAPIAGVSGNQWQRQRVFWKRASGADSGTYAFTHTTNITEACATRWTGVNQTGQPYEILQSATSGTGTTSTSPAVSGSAAQDGEMLVHGVTSHTSSAQTPSGTFTETYDAGGSGDLYVNRKTQTTAGATGTVQSTITPTSTMTATLIGLLPTAGSTNYTPTLPTENLGMTDSPVDVSIGYPRSPSDNLGLTDTPTALRAITPPLPGENAQLTDSLTYRGDWVRAPSETMIMSDTVIVETTIAPLTDYQFVVADIAPRVPFGANETLFVKTFDPGDFDTRDQDVDGNGDYRMFGTDYVSPPTWGWDMFTDTRDPADSLAWVDWLRQVWNNDVRKTPNGVNRLSYVIGGRARCVYGRPRRFTPKPDKINLGKTYISTTFVLAEDTYYDDDEQTVTLGMTPATVQGTGVVLPQPLPWHFNTSPAPRTSVLLVGGTKETWITPTFYGPVSNPWVQIGGLTFGLYGTVPLGQSVALKGRPWEAGVLFSTGQYRPDMLDARARLSQLQFKPGPYAVTYGGSDNTGSSRVVLAWRDASQSM